MFGFPSFTILNRLSFLSFLSLISALNLPATGTLCAADANITKQPNVVIIFTDDQGYQDVGVFGAEGFKTPNIDQLAHEGRTFTSFCVAQAVCSASRAALLTGCYPNRIGIRGALNHKSKIALNPNEMTLGELFKQKNYATAMVGKWHLGSIPEYLPNRHGFDEYFGLPYSNDMWPKHPKGKNDYPPLPLIKNEKTIQTLDDQSLLTKQYTEHAVSFIERNQDRPFFLYLAHSMPHVPLFTSPEFSNKTKQGPYGDVIEEIDWSVGQVTETLERLNLTDNTIVIFTSDNGPWLSYGIHGGSAKPLREGKGTSWEGGVRVPCIMRWPGHFPAGTTCSELVTSIDIFPTLANIISAKISPKRKIDGLDVLPILTGEKDAKTPHKYYLYYWINELHAVRSGPWKLHFPHKYRHVLEPGKEGKPGKQSYPTTGLELYNLETDISESHNVLAQHPEIVKQLQSYAAEARLDLGDSLQKKAGLNIRPAAKVTQRKKP